jgi:hypothetical protein
MYDDKSDVVYIDDDKRISYFDEHGDKQSKQAADLVDVILPMPEVPPSDPSPPIK